MKLSLLFVVNINQKLCLNARNSIMDAAQRWGFDYLEIRCPTCPGFYPSFEKLFKLAALDYTDIDTLVCVDADMLIRYDAPSPREVFGQGIHMVSDVQADESPAVQAAVAQEVHSDKYWAIAAYDVAKRASYQDYMFVRRNTGFIVVRPPAPVQIFKDAQSMLPRAYSEMALNGHCEQALINYASCNVPGANLVADSTWNRRSPPEGPMQNYVYHYTGWGYLEERQRILTFDWHSKA